MSDRIIDLQDWLQTDAGRYMLAWEQSQADAMVADMFGFHALQLGMPQLQGLAHNRMPHRWLAVQEPPEELPELEVSSTPPACNATQKEVAPIVPIPLGEATAQAATAGQGAQPQPGLSPALVTDFSALPFPAASLDLVVMPHSLELSMDAHATLREVERVLVPQGRVLICGFNPVGLWALRQARSRLWESLTGGRWPGQGYLPVAGEYIGYWRLRDWLRLLDFEVEIVRFGCYVPAVSSPSWLQRFAWMERLGPRWWPIFGSSYLVVAVKRVRGVRMLGSLWKPARARVPRQVPASQSNQDALHQEQKH
jgi:SAM-dependent methyltransferase